MIKYSNSSWNPKTKLPLKEIVLNSITISKQLL